MAMTAGDLKIDPDAAGLDPTRLERITTHLRERYVEPGKIAGCQTVVARHGAVAYFSSLGLMDVDRRRPVADDTIWRIYSMTKPITGVALMTLYEHGVFQLNDPVHRWIPEWTDLRLKDGSKPERPMSVRDALMHMTGLGWGTDEAPNMNQFLTRVSAVRSGPNPTLQGMVERLADKPLLFAPGTQWLYGLSTDVCARLVEVMAGQRFDDYLRSEVFEPLGMVDTDFCVAPTSADRLAALYGRRSDKTLRMTDDPETSALRERPTFLSGGGGLLSTTADYLRFCQMLLNGGELDGVRVLGRKTVELMTINHLPGGGQLRDFATPGGYGEVGFDGVGFGLTMAVGLGQAETQSVGSRGDFYWGGAASTIFWVDPAEDLLVIFMTQLMPSGTFNFRGQLRSIVYPAIVD